MADNHRDHEIMIVCPGCGEETSCIHRCPDCNCGLHVFCGTPVGEEGYGQSSVCPKCQEKRDDDQDPLATLLSSNPIEAGFQVVHNLFDLLIFIREPN